MHRISKRNYITMFKQPHFWKNINIISILLYPLSVLYLWISKIRYALQTTSQVNSQIICIGNATIGGSGKTPLAIAIGKLLLKHRGKISYVCKNYGANIQEATEVNKMHNSNQVIDEALLLSDVAPTFIAKKRIAAIKLANKKYQTIIVDDGLQNNSFHKNLSILAIANDKTFGNNFIFPAGPLRENLKDALKKTDLVVMIDEKNNSHAKNRSIIEGNFDKNKIFNAIAKYKFSGDFRKKYIAFAGIAHPENFFKSLEELNIKIIEKLNYPDHYHYSEQELISLENKAKKANAHLITTEKDFIRLRNKHKKKISYLKYELEILNSEKFLNHIELSFS